MREVDWGNERLADGAQAFPPCEPRCNPSEWPNKNLILGTCPRCTSVYRDESVLARILYAREVAAAYRPGTHQTVEEL